MSSSQSMLRCSVLSPIQGFIRKVLLVSHHILKERGVYYPITVHSSRGKVKQIELKLLTDWSTGPGTLC